MKQVTLQDNLAYQSTKELTPSGFLKGQLVLTKEGVDEYAEWELGISDSDNIVQVYRPASVVESEATINSAKMVPFTIGHPADDVTPENFKALAVGQLGDSIQAQDGMLEGPYVVTDPKAIALLQDESPQVSGGYSTMLKAQDGVFNGQSYQYVFCSDMIFNHVAIVDQGRAGPDVKVKDGVLKRFVDMLKKPKKSKVSDELDMDKLMPQLVAAVSPKLEELVDSEDFQKMLAAAVSAQLTGANQSDMDDEDVDADEDNDGQPPMADAGNYDYMDGKGKSTKAKTADTKATLNAVKTKTIDSIIESRLADQEYAKNIAKEFSIELADGKVSKSVILDEALKKLGHSPEGKTDEYKAGIVDSAMVERQKAKNHLLNVSDGALDADTIIVNDIFELQAQGEL